MISIKPDIKSCLRKYLFLILSLVILIFFQFLFFSFTVDDAYISYRYGKNLVECGELNWNCGEPHVEGYTNFLWTILFAFLYKFTSAPITIIKLIGGIFGIASLIIFYRMSLLIKSYLNGSNIYLPMILFSMTYAFAFWSVSGLETSMFLFFVMLGIHYFMKARVSADKSGAANYSDYNYSYYYSSFFFSIATLVRPEGLVFFASGMLYMIIQYRQKIKRLFFLLLKNCIAYSALVAPFLGWRLYYYRDIFPNTMHAKKALFSGMPDLINFFLFFIIFILIEAYFYYRYRHDDNKKIFFYLLLLQAVFIISLVNIKPIMSFVFRLYLPIIPLIYLYTIFIRIGKSRKWLMIIAIAVLLLLPLRHFIFDYKGMIFYINNNRNVNIPLSKEFDSDNTIDLIAIGDVGHIGYYTDKKILDMFALNDRYLAKNGFSADYVLGKEPDVIVIRSYSLASFEPVGIEGYMMYMSDEFHEKYELDKKVGFDIIGSSLSDQKKAGYWVYRPV